MISTTIFSSANELYEMYVLPYVVSALIHNPDARVEICLTDASSFMDRNHAGVDILHDHFARDRVLFRNIDTGVGAPPNSVRFLETPQIHTEYTYIGDIDILILEQISPLHIRRMSQASLPYSNVLRPGRQALTGLHFTRTDFHYPAPPPPDVKLNLDEELLYTLVFSKGVGFPPPSWLRPIHGFHLSPNRSPIPYDAPNQRTPNWGIMTSSRKSLATYENLTDHPTWQAIYPCFDRRYRLLLALLELALAHQHPSHQVNRNGEIMPLLTDIQFVNNIVRLP